MYSCLIVFKKNPLWVRFYNFMDITILAGRFLSEDNLINFEKV